jgi:hypothetical protein
VIAAPSWQDRRAELLQQACNEISRLVREDLQFGRAIKRIAKQFNGTELGDGRRLRLSEKTLQSIWYRWKRLRDPAVFRVKYAGSARSAIDPILLQLVVEYCLQTGAPLSEAIKRIVPKGAKVTVQQIYRAIPKRALDRLSESHRQLAGQRMKIENRFLRSYSQLIKKFLRAFQKQGAKFLREALEADARLRRRLIQQRDLLQQKFLAADARAVRRREQLQRKFLATALKTA